MKNNNIAKAVLPFMLLGSPALAGGSSVRSGSRFKVKKAVIQSSVKTDRIEKKEFKNPFGVFSNSKTIVKKTKDSQLNILSFLKENDLLNSQINQDNQLSGDVKQRKLFAYTGPFSLDSGKCYDKGEATRDVVMSCCTGNCLGDSVAPTNENSKPAQNSITDIQVVIDVDINEAGKAYAVVVANGATAPTSANVKSGQANGGGASISSSSVTLSTGAFTGTITLTGLTASTDYDVYVVAEDDEATPNIQASPTKVDISTNAPANTAPTITLPTTPIVFEDHTDKDIDNDINIADTDNDEQNVTLTATGGTITISGTGVSVTSSDGNSTDQTTITFDGTLANVNTALDSLTFSATKDLSGTNAGSIQVQTDDGNSGTDDETRQFDILASPTVTAIGRITPNKEKTNANSLTVKYTFSETVSGMDISDFEVIGSPNAITATATGVSNASGTTTEVTFSGGNISDLSTKVTIRLIDDNSIVNANGVPYSGMEIKSLKATDWYTLDNTAPVLTNTTQEALTAKSLTIKFDSGEAGTYYIVVSTSSLSPSASDVQSGSNITGMVEYFKQDMTASTNTIVLSPNLGPSTQYYYYIVSDDNVGDLSNTSNILSGNFTTLALDTISTLTASATVDETSMISIPITANSFTQKLDIFDFTITDTGTADGLLTSISELVLETSGTGDFSKMKWILNGNGIYNAVGDYSSSANTLTFSDMTIEVATGSSEEYTLSTFIYDTTGLVDNTTFGFSIDGDSNVTTSGNSSMASGQSAITNSTT